MLRNTNLVTTLVNVNTEEHAQELAADVEDDERVVELDVNAE
jgi:hypothetical protein